MFESNTYAYLYDELRKGKDVVGNKKGTELGRIVEGYYVIFFAFKIIELWGYEYQIYLGKYDNRNKMATRMEKFRDLFKKGTKYTNYRQGDDAGDIIIVCEKNKKMLVISSKILLSEHITDLDIEKISYYKKMWEKKGYTVEFGSITKSKQQTEDMLNNTRKEGLKEEFEKSKKWYAEDIQMYTKKFSEKYKDIELDEILDLDKTDSPNYWLHQELAIDMKRIILKRKYKKVMVLHHTCRSGKTLTSARLIQEENKKNYLFITTKPKETKKSIIETINNYKVFNDYKVIELY